MSVKVISFTDILLIICSFLSTKFYKNYAKTIDKLILLYYNAVNR